LIGLTKVEDDLAGLSQCMFQGLDGLLRPKALLGGLDALSVAFNQINFSLI